MATPRKVGFILEINGAKETIDRIAELELQLGDVTTQLREAKKAGDKDLYKKLRGDSANLRQEIKDLNKELREQVKQFKDAEFPEDSYRGLNRQLVNARREIKELSRAELEAGKGDALLKKIQKLDKELKDFDQTIGQNFRNVGNYEQAIENALGNLTAGITGNLGGLAAGLGAGGAIVAGLDLLADGAVYVAQITAEFVKLRGEVQNLSGATGDNLDEFTTRISAIGETFGQDVNEVLLSANALTEQLTGDFSKSLEIIETGLISGANANGEFLDILREYPTFINEAGLSADQFLNLIARSVDQGIFSDKGIDAIKEANLRLRELPQSTRDALDVIGISSEEIRKKIDEEGIGAAISEVSTRLAGLEKNSPEVGQALADIFGGAGEDAGLEFILSLQNIEDSTDDLIDQSNEYQLQQQRTLKANQELAAAQNELAKEIGGTGANLQNVSTIVQAGLIRGLTFLVDVFKRLFEALRPVGDAISRFLVAIGVLDRAGTASAQVIDFINKSVARTEGLFTLAGKAIAAGVNALARFAEGGRKVLEFLGLIKEQTGEATGAFFDLSKQQDDNTKQQEKRIQQQKQEQEETKKTTQSIESLRNQLKSLEAERDKAEIGSDRFNDLNEQIAGVNSLLERYKTQSKAAVNETKLVEDSIAALSKKVQELDKEVREATPEQAELIVPLLVQAQVELENAENLRQQLINRARDEELLRPIELLATGDQQTDDQGNVVDDPNAQDGVNQLIQELQLQTQAEQAIEAENQRVLTELRKRGEEDRLEAQRAASQQRLEEQQAEDEQRRKIVSDGLAAAGQLTEDLFSGQVKTFQEFQKQVIKILLDAAERVILLETAKAFGISLAQPDSIATLGAAGVAKFLVVQGLIKGFFSLVKSQVANFAEGGRVADLTNKPGLVTVPQNVPRQPSGDNVLAYVKRGEVILNKKQQSALQAMYGNGIFRQIGVPGFVDGGIVGGDPQLINPNVSGGNLNVNAQANLQAEQIAVLASVLSTSVANSVKEATISGIGIGLNDANRRLEREDLTNQQNEQ